MTLLRAAGLLVVGVAVGTATVWLHQRWWSLVLATVVTLGVLFASRRGLLRTAYALGWLLTAILFTLTRPEGDFVVAQDGPGYAYLGLAALVLVLTIATIPSPYRAGSDREALGA